jgi:hypothetical protein
MLTVVGHLELIRLFDFYLGVAFLLSTYRRIGQYRAIGGLALAVPGRWPRLLDLIHQHRTIFLTWSLLLPSALALGLWALQLLASRLVWHEATLHVADLADLWLAWPFLLVVGAGMVAVDTYGILVVGQVDKDLMEKYFDQAEYWLRAWQAPVVRFFTLGWINPRQMVAVEVRKALVEASRLINTTMWWVSMQTGLRLAFGLALWLTYAWSRGAW